MQSIPPNVDVVAVVVQRDWAPTLVVDGCCEAPELENPVQEEKREGEGESQADIGRVPTAECEHGETSGTRD